jgi:hypothetical protein
MCVVRLEAVGLLQAEWIDRWTWTRERRISETVTTITTGGFHGREEKNIMNSKSKYRASTLDLCTQYTRYPHRNYALLGNQRNALTRTLSHRLVIFNSLSMALELVLLDGESHLEQVLLLLHVGGLETSGDGSTGVAASVHDVLPVVVLGVVEKSLDSGLGE